MHAASAQDVAVEQLIKTTDSWNGVSLPDYSDAETEITMLKITIPPHTSLPHHLHPVINVAYMLKGELTVISAKGEKKIIKSGDPLVELVNQEHYGVNNGDDPVEILVVYFGQVGKPITVK
jgi:quercetin dioxygenase-like cupin family protein